jgi:hypothetical protein
LIFGALQHSSLALAGFFLGQRERPFALLDLGFSPACDTFVAAISFVAGFKC